MQTRNLERVVRQPAGSRRAIVWRGAAIALSLVLLGARVTAQSRFQRGDSDANGATNLTDAVVTLGFLFQGGTPPSCLDAADSNDDGQINLTDAVYELGFLFQGGAVPPAPFGECGVDPSDDALDCASFPPCGAAPLSVSVSAEPASGIAPLEVAFVATVEGADADPVVSIEWTFGDGGTASGAMVSHTFTAPGSYLVSVVVTTESGATLSAERTVSATDGGGGSIAGGFITVDHHRIVSCSFGVPMPTETFDVSAVFLEIEFEDLPDPRNSGCQVTESEVSGCRVVERICVFDGEIGEPPNLAELLEGVEGLDPGTPGIATSGGGADAELVATIAPELPLSEFIYSPTEGANLAALGFDCAQSVRVAFPGGAALAAFSVDVPVPPCFTGVGPVAAAGTCTLIPAAGDLMVSWDDAPGYSGEVEVVVGRETISVAGGAAGIRNVSITCVFPDDAGGGVIPAAALAFLPPPSGAFGTSTLELRRFSSVEVEVSRVGGGTRRLTAIGSESALAVEQLAGLPVPPFPEPGPGPLPVEDR